MQYFALGFTESHLVHVGLHLKLVHVPLCGIPAFYCIICINQLMYKVVEGILEPTAYVLDKDVEEYYSQDRSLINGLHMDTQQLSGFNHPANSLSTA